LTDNLINPKQDEQCEMAKPRACSKTVGMILLLVIYLLVLSNSVIILIRFRKSLTNPFPLILKM